MTLVDFPGKLACTVFLIGCNFRCPFCYSGELVLPSRIKKQIKIKEKEFFKFLREKKGLLEGVVICGGEPTINQDLPGFIEKIKRLGFLVKIDTNGSNPKMLEELINKGLIDYAAMDIKNSKDKYAAATGKKIDMRKIQKSIDILKQGKIDYEFRTTVVPLIHSKEDIIDIAKWISPAERYYLQEFIAEKETIDPGFVKVKSFPADFLLEIQKIVSPFFEVCRVR